MVLLVKESASNEDEFGIRLEIRICFLPSAANAKYTAFDKTQPNRIRINKRGLVQVEPSLLLLTRKQLEHKLIRSGAIRPHDLND